MNELVKDSKTNTYKTTLGSDNDEVIIGGKNPLVFEPHICFTKWNKENSLTIKAPSDLIASSTPILSAGKIELKDSKIGWYANPDPDNSENMKFGLVLYEKPTTNTWSFQLEGWEEFDFSYQPPLANINLDGSTWEDNGEGGRNERPIEVNGSYAIYHKRKANYVIGQVNYKTGKFGHYYRPKFIDADGKEVWVDLNIKDGLVTITIPKNFIDKAKYPIIANDTFGKTTVGASSTTHANNIVYTRAYSTPVSNGTLTSMSIYGCQYSQAGETFCPALYSDVSALPSARLAYLNSGGTAFPSFGNPNWVTTNISYNSIVSGTQYWLAHKSGIDNMSFLFYYDSVALESVFENNYFQGDYPATATPGSEAGGYWYSWCVSIYATYTSSGGAAAKKGNPFKLNRKDLSFGGLS